VAKGGLQIEMRKKNPVPPAQEATGSATTAAKPEGEEPEEKTTPRKGPRNLKELVIAVKKLGYSGTLETATFKGIEEFLKKEKKLPLDWRADDGYWYYGQTLP